MKRKVALVLLLGLLGVSPLLAHHSVYAEFNPLKQNTIEGVMHDIWFKSPHVRFYVAVEDGNGEQVIWDTHAHTPGTTRNAGWDEDTVPVGTRIRMTGDATRDGSAKLFVRKVELLDTGEVYYTSLVPRDSQGNPIDLEGQD